MQIMTNYKCRCHTIDVNTTHRLQPTLPGKHYSTIKIMQKKRNGCFFCLDNFNRLELKMHFFICQSESCDICLLAWQWDMTWHLSAQPRPRLVGGEVSVWVVRVCQSPGYKDTARGESHCQTSTQAIPSRMPDKGEMVFCLPPRLLASYGPHIHRLVISQEGRGRQAVIDSTF